MNHFTRWHRQNPEKMFCILYALTAIPIFGFVNIRVSQFMKQRYNGVKYRTFGKNPLKWQNNLSFVLYMIFGVCALFLFPAYGFSFLEGWTYADSGIGLIVSPYSESQAYRPKKSILHCYFTHNSRFWWLLALIRGQQRNGYTIYGCLPNSSALLDDGRKRFIR